MDHHTHNCCHKQEVKKGLWSEEEDQKLIDYINANGYKNWSVIPTLAGLQRCGKSCRLRWLNYLRPDLKRGNFTPAEARLIIQLHKVIGNKWAKIASYLPGRTDNEVKNYWNATIKKQLFKKKNQNSSTTTTTTIPSVTIPTPTTIASATSRGGGGGFIGGGSRGGVSYSSAPLPPPLPPFDHQGFNPNTFQEFGSFSNITANGHQMNFNANVINPEVFVPTPSIFPFQPTLNFNQISQGESFVPFMFPDITPSPEILDWEFPLYNHMNNPDSSMMMMANPQEINTVTNNITTTNNNTSTFTSGDDGMDFLDTIFSPFPPEPSPDSSASSFLEDQAYALINNPSVLSFHQFPENPNINMFGF